METVVAVSAISVYNCTYMKDAIILFILFLVVALTLFYGVTFLMKKTIKSTPKVEHSEDYERMMRDQRRRMEDLQDQQRRMMRDQKQRIRDLQRL